MKKIFTLIVLLLVIGAGCKNSEPVVIEKDYFDKKVKCATYREDVDKKYAYVLGGSGQSVQELFYSPIKDSCLVVVHTVWEKLPESYKIYDVLSGLYLDNVEAKNHSELEIKAFEMVQKYK